MKALQIVPQAHTTRVEDSSHRAIELIRKAIERRWASGLLNRSNDGVFAAFLGGNDIERLFQLAADEANPDVVEPVYDRDCPLGALVHRWSLPPSAADLLAVLLAAEVDPVASRLGTYLGGNQTQFVLTLDLVFEIVYRGRMQRREAAAGLLQRDLAAAGLLRRLGVVVVEGGRDARLSLNQALWLHPHLTAWLVGAARLDPELAAFARMLPPQRVDVGAQVGLDAKLVDSAAAALRDPGRVLLVDGPLQSGRELLVRQAAARLDRPLLLVSAQGLGPERLMAAFRQALLDGALLAFQAARAGLEGETLVRFRECLEVYPGPVALIDSGSLGRVLAGLRPETALRMSVPAHGERRALWKRHLGEDTTLTQAELERIAALYNLGLSGILQSCQMAREMAAFAGAPVGREHVGQAMRQLFEGEVDAVATRMEVTQTWQDLVLPEEVGESIYAILDQIRYREDVLGGWGFARKLGKGWGLTVLLSGEPGTGKSMLAGLIAAELGLDLYVIDLSRVTSKWLGETEKSLGRAFDAAEAGHVVLLFDEADSVLGKRSSDPRSAGDRHANQETNFLLARLERFQGTAFFTTNLPSALDPAMARRMSFHVRLPYPDAKTRAELWRRMLPQEMPRATDIDFETLGERYELSGGFIRNIVLRAAYRARSNQEMLCLSHLEEAAAAEYRERGFIAVGGRIV